MKKRSVMRLFTLLLAIMMVLPMLAACGEPEVPQTNNKWPVNMVTGDYVILAENGLTDFSGVYSKDAKTLTKSEFLGFVEYVEEVTDARMNIVEDASRYSDKEIIIGVVGSIGRQDIEDAVAKYNIEVDDYVIMVHGNALVIACGSKESSVMALTMLKKRLLLVDEERKLVAVPKDLCYVFDYDNKIDRKGHEKVTLNAKNSTELLFTLNEGSEKDVPCRLTYTGNGGWRIQSKYSMAEAFTDVGAAQSLNLTLGKMPEIKTEKLIYWQEGDNVIAKAPDGSYAVLNTASFSLKFCDAEGNLSRMITEMNHTITGRTDILTLYMNFTLDDHEAIYGSGERFDTVNQRGQEVIVQSGESADDISNSYVAIPLFSSSNGSGIFINNNSYMEADIGKSDYNEMSVTMYAGNIDCYVFVTDQISDVIQNYNEISGYAEMPEEWMSDLIVCSYKEEVNTLDAVKNLIVQMESYDMPWSGVMIEGWDITDYDKHEELKQVCDLVHAMGKKVICNVDIGFYPGEIPDHMNELLDNDDIEEFYLKWKFTYAYSVLDGTDWVQSSDSKTTVRNIPMIRIAGQMLTNPVFATKPSISGKVSLNNPFDTAIEGGNRAISDDDYYYDTKTYLDITNPEAVEWFFGVYWTYLVDYIGVDGAKVVGGNMLPDTVGEYIFYDESMETGGTHHWYTTTFTAKLNEILSAKPDGGICFTNGGGIGSQLNNVILGGEQSRTVNRLERQIRGLLSAGLSGLPFVSYDIGGSFYKLDNVQTLAQEADIFLRGAQFAIFTMSMQTADGSVRNAFDFAAESEDYAYVLELYRYYTVMHQILNPYIQEYSEIACETGLPLARHLVLMWQDDENVYDLDDEYMFGDAFLVAPELYGQASRAVYLPEGEWVNLFTGAEYSVGAEGLTVTCDVTMAQIPLFYNKNNESETVENLLGDLQYVIDAINAVEMN